MECITPYLPKKHVSENANGKNNAKVGNLIIQLANCTMMLQLVKLMEALAGFTMIMRMTRLLHKMA